MREFKCRAWDKEIDMFRFDIAICCDGRFIYETGQEVEPYIILEQYTGLTDKNGTKIFEGDTVRFISPFNTYEAKVIFAKGSYWLAVDEQPRARHFQIYNMSAYEIIGNIHKEN